ncbi:hypothetical protein OKW21_003511 [Catalinimonas alkaloidigena]|uniref:hypothetical protein n=1 Tax=Catalinimonas alkaloidigena TaxID=1075417 RepID=UPI0024054053|nr:hypothetical protein [Catalinimonas alkaloidigena]MDF9798248.1 hypothetical protein [Catalinimonas alkaloidigena]
MNVEDQLRQVDFKDPDQVINFYELNRIYYDNYQRLEDTDKISKFIDIKLHYANSLTENHHFDKMISVLEEVSQLLEKLSEEHWNYKKSERHIRFLKGMVLARKKKFKESYLIFKRLAKEDPEHYYYKVWYDHAKLGTYNWAFNGMSIIGGVLIFSDLIFSLSDKLPLDIGIVGLIILGSTYLTQKGLYEYLKRKKLL